MNNRKVLIGQIEIENVLNQTIIATLSMFDNDTDMDILKVRLQTIREVATGLGVDIQIPSNRQILMRRFKSSMLGGEL